MAIIHVVGGSGWPMGYYYYHHLCLINELVVGKCWCTISEAEQCLNALAVPVVAWSGLLHYIQEKAASVVGNGECGWSASSLGVIMSTEL